MVSVLATVLALVGIGINLALMVYLMDVIKIVSAVQAAWGAADGFTQSIPWIPMFVIIPMIAIGGAVFAAERFFKLAQKQGAAGVLRFWLKVLAVQAGAWWIGKALLVLLSPVSRTSGNFTVLALACAASVVLWVFPDTPQGVKLFGEPKRKAKTRD